MDSIPHRVYIRREWTGSRDIWHVSIPGVLRIATNTFSEALAIAQPYLDVLSLCVHQATQPTMMLDMPVGRAADVVR